ncbi:phage major tail tube protein [Paenibacillus agilis]|uniref:Phage tail protein n=1 Tax=Paenibacillus agilis TaxID=3020863 RepID=A0A559IZL5_9BACL|nr:phage major tail tube protein [Paenibacillus agilis]TVX93047.1 phage tail protein [Paenibacillus agilis]
MSLTRIDEKVIQYTVWLNGNTHLGTALVQLPEIKMPTESLKGAGIAGVIESTTPGYFEPMTLTMNWRTTSTQEATRLLAPNSHFIVLRAAIQVFDKVAQETLEVGKTVTFRATTISHALGKVEGASAMDGNTVMSCSYLKNEEDSRVLYEIDQLNSIYNVNGKDYLARRRSILGL